MSSSTPDPNLRTIDLSSPPQDESAIHTESNDDKGAKDEKDEKVFKTAKAADVIVKRKFDE
jgi:predicted nuclease of predicted toxin-antitoxin system